MTSEDSAKEEDLSEFRIPEVNRGKLKLLRFTLCDRREGCVQRAFGRAAPRRSQTDGEIITRWRELTGWLEGKNEDRPTTAVRCIAQAYRISTAKRTPTTAELRRGVDLVFPFLS